MESVFFYAGTSIELIASIGLNSFMERIKKAGFLGVEIKCEQGIIDPENIKKGEVQKLKDRLNSLGLKVSVHATFIDVNIASFYDSIRKASIQRIKACLKLAFELESEWVTVHCGHLLPNAITTVESALTHSLSSLKEIALEAEKLNLRIGLENKDCAQYFRNLFLQPNEGLWLIKNLENDLFGFIFDCGHANTCKSDVAAFYQELKDDLIAIHAHDNEGSYDQHLAVGKGTIDFKKILQIEKPEKIVIECDTEEDLNTSKQALTKLINEI